MSRGWPAIVGVLFCGALFCGVLAAQGKPGKGWKGIRFVESYAAALEEAAGRGCPVLVCVTNEQAHEQTTRFLYEDKGVIKMARDFVCIVAHENTSHTSEYGKRLQKKNKTKLCPFYGTIGCKAHAAAWRPISNRFLRHSVVQKMDIPQHIYVNPHGDEELFRRRGPVGIRDMKYDLKRALKLVGSGLDLKPYRTLKQMIDTAEQGLSKGQIRPAAKQLDRFRKFRAKHKKAKSALYVKGDALIKHLTARGEAAIADAIEFAKKGQKARAIEVLENVAREYAPFAVAEKARRTMRDVQLGHVGDGAPGGRKG